MRLFKSKKKLHNDADNTFNIEKSGKTKTGIVDPGKAQLEIENSGNEKVKKKKTKHAVAASQSNEPLLVARNVTRTFYIGSRELQVLKGINLEIKPKQLVMLRGRSGSGKTTLLNLIGGLDQPTSGEVHFLGHAFHQMNDQDRTLARRKNIGFIFQTYALMPLLSAYENVELSMRMSKYPKSEWRERALLCLDKVGLSKRADHRPFELSGGEQQRVAIAKALAHKPRIILADEPTAELDSQMGAHVITVFRELIESENLSICMTTHDPTILEVADHVYEMVDGKFKK